MTRRSLRSTLLVSLAALLAIGTSGCARMDRLDFTAVGRAFWQRPVDVIDALEVPGGATVADLGAGKGYFTAYLANAVGINGRVYAVEVETKLTDRLRERFADRPNVHVVLGAFDDPLLPDGQMNLILIVNTFHHIADRVKYFERLRGDLAPGGRVAILEPDSDLGGIVGAFVTAKHSSRSSDILREMRSAGYRRVAHHDLLPTQVFEVYSPQP